MPTATLSRLLGLHTQPVPVLAEEERHYLQGFLLGLDQARAHADELCALAHAALARSGLPDTRALAALADMVVSRTH
mgnify:CR=1 FL=1